MADDGGHHGGPRKKTKEERAAERESAKQLLLETNLIRVFNILCGFAQKRPLEDELETVDRNLKKLRAQVDTERALFDTSAPKMTQAELKVAVERTAARHDELTATLKQIERTVHTVGPADIMEMFDKLGYDGPEDEDERFGFDLATQIDRMIFECDEGLNGCLTLEEVMRAYYRSVHDATNLEPFALFNLVQFLMYDEDLGGSCSTDEVVALMYSRYGEKQAEEHVREMLENDDGDGEVSYAEYLQTVEKRPSLALLRRKGKGIAAQNSIYIDWMSIMEAKKLKGHN